MKAIKRSHSLAHNLKFTRVSQIPLEPFEAFTCRSMQPLISILFRSGNHIWQTSHRSGTIQVFGYCVCVQMTLGVQKVDRMWFGVDLWMGERKKKRTSREKQGWVNGRENKLNNRCLWTWSSTLNEKRENGDGYRVVREDGTDNGKCKWENDGGSDRLCCWFWMRWLKGKERYNGVTHLRSVSGSLLLDGFREEKKRSKSRYRDEAFWIELVRWREFEKYIEIKMKSVWVWVGVSGSALCFDCLELLKGSWFALHLACPESFNIFWMCRPFICIWVLDGCDISFNMQIFWLICPGQLPKFFQCQYSKSTL